MLSAYNSNSTVSPFSAFSFVIPQKVNKKRSKEREFDNIKL